MQLILGGINGRYLRELVDNAGDETERVDAIVAYASDMSLLFDWCWDKSIPLRFWGRFDEGLPVSLPILKKFLERSSPAFECRLVRKLHAKVIWWRGYGIYIGSANLTSSAWYNNIEAGVFLDEGEFEGSEHVTEIEALFRTTHAHSAPLTRELVRELEVRERSLAEVRRRDKAEADRLLANPNVPFWDGLSMRTVRSARDEAKEEFLKEWNETLEKMRSLAAKVAANGNRPIWIPDGVPAGAQADQFLHAHYYQRTFDGRRAMYETHFEKNRGAPQRAVDEAISWWKSLKSPPGGEDVMLNEWAVLLRDVLSNDKLRQMTESDLLNVCQRVHAMRDHARRIANKDVGLPAGRPYTIPEKVEALARFLFAARSTSGASVADTIEFVLYDGSKAEVPQRIWEATTDPKWRLDHFGISAIGELVGWAMPDDFPPRNGRTSKALRSLGYDVEVHA